MTYNEAQKIIDGLMGWADPRIETNEYGDVYITAIDPVSNRRLEYDPTSGMFG